MKPPLTVAPHALPVNTVIKRNKVLHHRAKIVSRDDGRPPWAMVSVPVPWGARPVSWGRTTRRRHKVPTLASSAMRANTTMLLPKMLQVIVQVVVPAPTVPRRGQRPSARVKIVAPVLIRRPLRPLLKQIALIAPLGPMVEALVYPRYRCARIVRRVGIKMFRVKPIVKIVAKADTPMARKAAFVKFVLRGVGTTNTAKRPLLLVRNAPKENGLPVLNKSRKRLAKIVPWPSIPPRWVLRLNLRAWLVPRESSAQSQVPRKVIAVLVWQGNSKAKWGNKVVTRVLRASINLPPPKPNV